MIITTEKRIKYKQRQHLNNLMLNQHPDNLIYYKKN